MIFAPITFKSTRTFSVLLDNVENAFHTRPDSYSWFVPKCHQALLSITFYISLNLPRIRIGLDLIIGELDHPHKRKNSSSHYWCIHVLVYNVFSLSLNKQCKIRQLGRINLLIGGKQKHQPF